MPAGRWLGGVPKRSNPLHLAAAGGHAYMCRAIVQVGGTRAAHHVHACVAHKEGGQGFWHVCTTLLPQLPSRQLPDRCMATQTFLERSAHTRLPDPRSLFDGDGYQPYMVAGNRGQWLCAQMLLLLSRDDTHNYWAGYGFGLRDVSAHGGGGRGSDQASSLDDEALPGSGWQPLPELPSLAGLAHSAWLQHLQAQAEKAGAPHPGLEGAACMPQPACVQDVDSGDASPACIAPLEEDTGSARTLSVAAEAQQQGQVVSTDLLPATGAAANVSAVAARQRLLSSSSDGGANACGVCFERAANVVMASCGHSMCSGCSVRVVALCAERARKQALQQQPSSPRGMSRPRGAAPTSAAASASPARDGGAAAAAAVAGAELLRLPMPVCPWCQRCIMGFAVAG
jgi:hypothetical protein